MCVVAMIFRRCLMRSLRSRCEHGQFPHCRVTFGQRNSKSETLERDCQKKHGSLEKKQARCEVTLSIGKCSRQTSFGDSPSKRSNWFCCVLQHLKMEFGQPSDGEGGGRVPCYALTRLELKSVAAQWAAEHCQWFQGLISFRLIL